MSRLNIIWARAFASLLVVAGVGVSLAMWLGIPAGLAGALLLTVGQVVFNTFHTQRLWRLLDAPTYGEVPSAPGLWGEIYYRLHKLAKRWHGQVRQIEQQHALFIQAIQAAPNGVVMLDNLGRIEWCNGIAGEHFGLQAQRDLGQHISHLVRDPGFVRYLNLEHYDEQLRMHGMGHARQNALAVQIFPYGDRRKLVLSQDITELERTDSMRRDFVANVSHELKTPLTVMSGFIETVRELPLTEEERNHYLDIMAQQTGRMQNIVNDLLTLAKLEGDSKPVVDQPVEMDRLIGMVVNDAQELSGRKHTFEVEVDAGLAVRGAESELYSAMGNLLTNAVRYTPEKGIIRVCWRLGGTQAEFSVSDTGIGIPHAHIPRLTERFYRVDRSRSRDTGGTGLGLAIVKHILQRHQARLDVRSEEGKGSTFTVRFPEHRTVRIAPASNVFTQSAR